MDLSRNVKQKPWWLIVPGQLARSKGYAVTIGSVVYLPKTIYEDLQSDYPNPLYVSMLLHELTHVERITKVGRWKFAWRYLFSRRFRFQEEVLAMEASIPYLKAQGLDFAIERRARRLSSWVYGWCVDYEVAKEELERVWGRVKI